MYGDKKVTTTAAQAYEWMMQTFEDLDTVTDRANAGLQTLAAQPEFEGRYSEEGAVHPFKLRVLQFVPSSQAINGEIEWPTFRGATRFRGQLVSTNEGPELTFKETDFVSGKASSKLLLGASIDSNPKLVTINCIYEARCDCRVEFILWSCKPP